MNDQEELSECCGAPRYSDSESDICSECGEHTEFTTEDQEDD